MLTAPEGYRLNFRIIVPTNVAVMDINRAKFNRSFKNMTPIATAKMMLVSRRADTNGIGTTVIAQMIIQAET